jgi:hypothetical protein
LEPSPGPKAEEWIKSAGFINVQHEIHPIPTGKWPKDKKLVSKQYLSVLVAYAFASERSWRVRSRRLS